MIITKAALSSDASGPTGGYLVPPAWDLQIRLFADEMAIMRPRCFTADMASHTLDLPFPTVTTAQSAGTSAMYGGFSMTWAPEDGSTIPESEPTVSDLQLKAKILSGYMVVSNPLLQDGGPAVSKWLMTLIARSVAAAEDYAFFQGQGGPRPTGIINAAGAYQFTRTGGANKIVFGDIAGMLGHLLPASYNNAIWAFNPSVMPQLLQMADGTNRAVFLQAGASQNPKDATWSLLGRPAFASERLSTLGSVGDVVLFDPNYYCVGHRGPLLVSTSPHDPTQFLKNRSILRVIDQADGQPLFGNTITLQDGTTVVSPYVILK